MKISVILSTYNGENYIIEQLQSICGQLRAPDEVLIFDDCSTDNTCGIVEDFIESHRESHDLSGWKLIRNAANKGWRRNFMEGLREGSGDLLFPCDQDDIWKKEKLRDMEQIMEDHPDINVLTSNYEAFYENGTSKVLPEPEDGKLIHRPEDRKIFFTRYPGCTYCVRREFLQAVWKYWQEDFPHDAFLWRAAMFSGSLYSYNTALIRWRRHSDSTYTLESVRGKTLGQKKEWVRYAKRSVLSLREYLQDNHLYKKERQQILEGSLGWLECREAFFDRKSPAAGAKLAKYLSYYSKPKQYIGDWYLVFLKK